MADKIKLLTISDFPLAPSGVALQTKYMIEGLLATGKYKISSFGAAMSHKSQQPIRFNEYGEDWTIYPTIGYGDAQILRDFLDYEKPDALWFMTDPRFYGYLFSMHSELQDRGIPLLYSTIWDNYPVPKFNHVYYKACDFLGCISKLTHDIVNQLGFADKAKYIPHAVDANIFKPLPREEVKKLKLELLGEVNKNKFIFFYNSRNARRKRTNDVIHAFKQFVDKVGQDKAVLFMHTDPRDQEGSNLFAVCEMLGIKSDQIIFSTVPVAPEKMAQMYNISDITVCLSDNEGFGLSCLESLSCGTPAVINETGGLQDQIRDENGLVFGVSIKPATRSIQGSQAISYIFSDVCAIPDVVNAFEIMYNLSWDERKDLGLKAAEWTRRAFRMDKMISDWDSAIVNQVDLYKTGKAEYKRVRVNKV